MNFSIVFHNKKMTEEFLTFIQQQPEFEKIQQRFRNKQLSNDLPINVFTLKRRNATEMEKIISINSDGTILERKTKDSISFITNRNKCLVFIPKNRRFDNVLFETAIKLKEINFEAIFFDSDTIVAPEVFDFLKNVV